MREGLRAVGICVYVYMFVCMIIFFFIKFTKATGTCINIIRLFFCFSITSLTVLLFAHVCFKNDSKTGAPEYRFNINDWNSPTLTYVVYRIVISWQ